MHRWVHASMDTLNIRTVYKNVDNLRMKTCEVKLKAKFKINQILIVVVKWRNFTKKCVIVQNLIKLYALRFLPAHLKATLPVFLHFNTFISNTLKKYIFKSLPF